MLSGGEYGIIQAIEKEELSTPEETYNFEVAEYHTYYVGDNGVLVHNLCTTKPLENHHIMTDKHKVYTKYYKDLLSGKGLAEYNLTSDPSNIVRLPHRGRHTTAYHEYIKRRVENFFIEPNRDIEQFRNFMIELGEELKANPSILYSKHII